jgi:hypothetical protein
MARRGRVILLNVFERFRHRIGFLLLTNKSFRFFSSLGVHLTPVHYYSPIPDLRDLFARPEIWDQPSDLPGIDMNTEDQLRLMEEVFAAYLHECDFRRMPGNDPSEFYTQNDYFGYVSAVAMHSMIRHYRPRRIIEIGAGHSTRVVARAVSMNADAGSPAELIVVDPFLDQASLKGLQGISEFIPCRVETVHPAKLQSLQDGDLLSIDASHVVRLGGDVVFLYLEILPRLAPGVWIHIHDIFLPYDYPKHWLQQRQFWSEQYLLQAFLVYNNAFQVAWAQRYIEAVRPDVYGRIFGGRTEYAENFDSYSFWLRRSGTFQAQ